MRTVALLALVMVGSLPLRAGAQNAPSPLEPLLKACRLLRGNKALAAAEQNNATLTQKVQALNDKDVHAALNQVRGWLNQPAVSTVGALSSDNPLDPPFNDIAMFRELARIFIMEQYVLLSEGRTGAAIASARDGLRIAYAVKPNTFSVSLVAAAMEVLATDTLIRHLDQMSLTDCRELLQLARDWTNEPDVTATMLALERRQQKAMMRPLTLEGPPQPPPPDKDPTQKTDADKTDGAIPPEFLHMTKAEWQAMLARTEARLDRMYAEYEANLKLPVWELLHSIETRKAPAPTTAEERFADALIGPIRPLLDTFIERRAAQLARAHALGVNAAIYAYRWEHNHLPDSLAALNLGEMALDPFTGQPFLYTATGTRYTMESAGPCKRDENDNPVPNARTPISLGPKESVFPLPAAPADKQPGS